MIKEDDSERTYASLGKYVMLKTLGAGATAKVKLGYDPETITFYAIKIIKPTYVAQKATELEKEVNLLSNLDHPNIVKLIDVFPNIEYVKKNGEKHEVVALVFEHVPGGDLFEYIFHSGRFAENIARTYFRCLIEGIQYCHENGIAHRDLKPENILFDENFNLKIADFGFATLLCGREENGKLSTYVGTEAYMAPEILKKQVYNGSAVDIFACGIILFIMVSRNPPFAKATAEDNHYKYMVYNQHDTYWDKAESGKPVEHGQSFYSLEFRDLINGMLHPEPTMRLTLPEILEHPWYNGPYVPLEELQEEFVQRRQIIDESLEKEKIKKKEYKKHMAQSQHTQLPMGAFAGYKPYRSHKNDDYVDLEEQLAGKIDFDAERKMDKYNKTTGFKLNTEVFGKLEPEELLKIVCFACETNLTEYKVSSDKYKIKGLALRDEGRCSLNILITKMEKEDAYCIEFHRIGNNGYVFANVVEGLKKKIHEFIESAEDSDDEENGENGKEVEEH